MLRLSALALGLFALSLPATAGAAARQFPMTADGTSMTPEGDVEIESWLEFGHPADKGHQMVGQRNTIWWLGFRTGLFENVDVAQYVLVEQKNKEEIVAGSGLYEEGKANLLGVLLDVKWRPLASRVTAVDPFVQFQYTHWAEDYHPEQLRTTLGVSKRVGRVLGAVNASYWESTVVDSAGEGSRMRWRWVDGSAALSTAIVRGAGKSPELAIGAELWALRSLGKDVPGGLGVLDDVDHVHAHQVHRGGLFVGPSASMTRGRIWAAGHAAIPVQGYHREDGESPALVRFILGIAL